MYELKDAKENVIRKTEGEEVSGSVAPMSIGDENPLLAICKSCSFWFKDFLQPKKSQLVVGIAIGACCIEPNSRV